MESEMIALNDSFNEVKFIKKLLQFIEVEISNTNYYCDNKPTIMRLTYQVCPQGYSCKKIYNENEINSLFLTNIRLQDIL